MTGFEYKVIPAPARGLKARGVKTPEARFANALETSINELAADGWEYVRAETLPSEERQGLTGTATHFRNVLIFRKAVVEAVEEVEEDTPTALLEAPEEETSPEEVAEAPEDVVSDTDTAADENTLAADSDAAAEPQSSDETR